MTDMPLQWNVCTLLCADTRGHGRYIIKKFETEWLLELNGELIGRFRSPGEARARAEVGVKTARKMVAGERGTRLERCPRLSTSMIMARV